jgi:hypothetical protein
VGLFFDFIYELMVFNTIILMLFPHILRLQYYRYYFAGMAQPFAAQQPVFVTT